MQDFFRVDGLYYRGMMKVWSLFILNCLMLLTSLPIVTIGTVKTAGFEVAFRMITLDETKIISCYFSAFKKNFRKSSLVWLLVLLVSSILLINWQYLITYQQLSSWLTIGVAIVTLLVSAYFQYIFFYLARYEDTLVTASINVLKIALSYPLWSLLLILSFIFPLGLMLLSAKLFVFGLYIGIFFGVSAIHYVRTWLLVKLFTRIKAS